MSTAVSSSRTTVIIARKKRPRGMILPITLPRYSAVLRPGRIPKDERGLFLEVVGDVDGVRLTIAVWQKYVKPITSRK